MLRAQVVGGVARGIIVGAGYFGRNWMRIIGAREDCRLAALVAADAVSLQGALAERTGAAPLLGYERLDEAIEREHPDFAIVAVPESAHREVVCHLLAAGVDTLCEKPLAMTREDATAIVAAQAAHPRTTLMIDQQFRWRPSIQTLRTQVRQGVIGTLGDVHIHHRQEITRTTIGGWRETMVHPYLFDMAVHFFDLVRYLSGQEAEAIYARAYRPSWSWFGGAPALLADLALTGGVHAEVSGTFVAKGFQTVQEGIITLAGSEGTLRYGEDRTVRLYRDERDEAVSLAPMPETDCSWALTHFLGCLRSRARPETDLVDNLKTFSIVLAALESDTRGARIPVRSV